MKRFLLTTVMMLLVGFLFGQGAQDLFFSEYVEGSSNNKYLEIFNGTGSPVDLSDYQVLLFANGSATATNTQALTGTLDNGAVFVLKNSSATIYTGSALSSSATNFNGDDAVALKKISTGSYVDIFGQIGVDPGTSWVSGSHSTVDRTLVRKEGVIGGITTNPVSGFQTLESEWSVYAIDNISDLGRHTFTPPVVTGTITLTSPVAGTYQTGASFNFSWTSDGVTQVKFQVRPNGTTTWEDMEISPVDASLGTFPFEVPTSATGGNYDLRIVDANNAAVYSNSVTVTVEDKHFAGLSDNPFWPENSSVDVPVDLFANYMVLGFDEPVVFGAGSINLRKKSDNSLVYSYNASSNNWAFHSEWDGALILKIDADLLPNTGYYVTIDDDAIVDGANPANAYLGFSDNATWSFTTGEGNSIIPIAVVQAPDMNGNSTLAGNGFSYKTQGVVMFTHNSGYIIQDGTDEHSGLYVYQSNHGLEVGDYVQVIGKVTEFNKLTELTEVEYTKVVSKGNPLYAPVTLIGALTEAYESMLVNISNIECKSGFDTYNEFVVTNSEVDWTIDNWLYKLTPNPVVGDKYVSITGFVNDYNGLKIAPRSLSDFEKVTTAVEKVSVPSLFARLIKGELKVIASKPVASVNLYNIAGSTMMSTAAEGDTDDKGKEITIPVKKIAGAGIYVVEITYEDGTTEVVKVVAE